MRTRPTNWEQRLVRKTNNKKTMNDTPTNSDPSKDAPAGCMKRIVLRLFHGFFSRFHDAALLAAIRRQDMAAIMWHAKIQNHHATRLMQISPENSHAHPPDRAFDPATPQYDRMNVLQWARTAESSCKSNARKIKDIVDPLFPANAERTCADD